MVRYYILYVILLCSLLYVYGCEGLVSNQSKPDVPSDHNLLRGIFFHKPGDQEAEGCDECHGEDLRGGIQSLNGRYIFAQSCYQCHGELWGRHEKK